MTILTSRTGVLVIGEGAPLVLINDQVQVLNRSSEVPVEVQHNLIDRILAVVRKGHDDGMHMVDILVNAVGTAEADLMRQIAVTIHEEIGCPIALDTRNVDALAYTLEALKPYKLLINSVTPEPACLKAILPIAIKYNAAIVGMPVSARYGVPMTVEKRLSEAKTIIDAAMLAGIPKEDIIIDALCLPSTVMPGNIQIAQKTIEHLHSTYGVSTILGISNASYGMPDKTHIELAYLLAAASSGLDAALVNPHIPLLFDEVNAIDFLTARDADGKKYITHYRKKQEI